MDFNKLKVADLRKLITQNKIFHGGLSSMKKRDLLDKIYESEWYRANHSGDLSEKELLERQLKVLEEKLINIKEPTEELKPEVEVVEVVEPIPEVEVVEEVEEPTEVEQTMPEVEEKLDERIQKAIQEALHNQKEQMMLKLFG